MSNDLLVQKNGGFMEPKTSEIQQRTEGGAIADAKVAASVQDIQAMMIIAKRFPRNEAQIYEKVMDTCKRRGFAEAAQYCKPKGNSEVTGPTIRFAEALAQIWGNMKYGVEEISKNDECSVIEAYAWDVETNTKSVKSITVPHQRYTKAKGNVKLTSVDDIYEVTANRASRGVRNCILALLPGDLKEDAITQCEKTLASDVRPKSERIKEIIDKFNEYGVLVAHIEARLKHKLDAISETTYVTLKKIYRSIRDGYAQPKDFFNLGNTDEPVAMATDEDIDELIKNKAKPKAPPSNAPVDKETGEVKAAPAPEVKK